MWYWNPEQPPPTTATRNATGTGFCMPMISLTLVLAVGVRLIISSFGLRSQSNPRCIFPVQYSKPCLQLHMARSPEFLLWKPTVEASFDNPITFAYNKMRHET